MAERGVDKSARKQNSRPQQLEVTLLTETAIPKTSLKTLTLKHWKELYLAPSEETRCTMLHSSSLFSPESPPREKLQFQVTWDGSFLAGGPPISFVFFRFYLWLCWASQVLFSPVDPRVRVTLTRGTDFQSLGRWPWEEPEHEGQRIRERSWRIKQAGLVSFVILPLLRRQCSVYLPTWLLSCLIALVPCEFDLAEDIAPLAASLLLGLWLSRLSRFGLLSSQESEMFGFLEKLLEKLRSALDTSKMLKALPWHVNLASVRLQSCWRWGAGSTATGVNVGRPLSKIYQDIESNISCCKLFIQLSQLSLVWTRLLPNNPLQIALDLCSSSKVSYSLLRTLRQGEGAFFLVNINQRTLDGFGLSPYLPRGNDFEHLPLPLMRKKWGMNLTQPKNDQQRTKP